MVAYCSSCFRDLPSEDAQCRSCSVSSAMSFSSSSVVLCAVVFAMIMAGVLTLNTHLCIAGAAIGVIALVIHIARAH
jgi:membrane protein YdbS with pleckstrin-like domain